MNVDDSLSSSHIATESAGAVQADASPRARPDAPGRGAAADPRERLRVLPQFAQLPLTWAIGKPYRGQQAPRPTASFHLATAAASLICGMLLTAMALDASWPLLLPGVLAGWAVTLHGMRNLRMMILHQCAHRNMWRRRTPDLVLGQFLSALLLVQHFDAYSREHVADHHAVHHMTLRDPTVKAMLIGLGLRPDMTRRAMWRRLLGRLVSPVFHARFLVSRVRTCWSGAAPAARAGLVAGYALLSGSVALAGSWPALVVVWLLPLTVLFQISNTLRLCVKHTFPAPGEHTPGREHFASLTNAIFLASPPPPAHLPPLRRSAGWTVWGLKMLCVHLPSRYLVLTGDTVTHDFHHRHPMTRHWADYVFARQRDLENGHPGWPPYQEAWGLRDAIDRVFDSLRAADPEVFDAARIRGADDRLVFAAFDD